MKFLLTICFAACLFQSQAQSKNAFYALDANLNATTLDSSKYLLWIHEKEDSNWIWDYYNTWGPLIKSQSFADHDGTIPNGKSYYYNKIGNQDSISSFDHGKKNGGFYKYRSVTADSVIPVMYFEYAQDSLVKSINYILDTVKKEPATTDSAEKESEYPGGIKDWFAYLQKNLTYPDRAINKEVQGMVKIEFVVDKEGKVENAHIFKSVEYSLDQEALRVIKNSGLWQPAFQFGHQVKSYKRMPVNFKLQ